MNVIWLPCLASRGLCQDGLVTRNEANPRAVRHSRRWQVDGRNKALGELRLQVSGGAQKEARLVGRTAGQMQERGQWKVARGVGCVCGKGREKWPQKLAMKTGFI